MIWVAVQYHCVMRSNPVRLIFRAKFEEVLKECHVISEKVEKDN